MNRKLSVCGSDYATCEYSKKSECRSCSEIKGKVFWTNYISTTICPIYNCATNEKKYDNCGGCPEIPCKLWQKLKDPSHTDEQHETSINDRITNLKKLKENKFR